MREAPRTSCPCPLECKSVGPPANGLYPGMCSPEPLGPPPVRGTALTPSRWLGYRGCASSVDALPRGCSLLGDDRTKTRYGIPRISVENSRTRFSLVHCHSSF